MLHVLPGIRLVLQRAFAAFGQATPFFRPARAARQHTFRLPRHAHVQGAYAQQCTPECDLGALLAAAGVVAAVAIVVAAVAAPEYVAAAALQMA